jgi:hypothetical protein
MSGFAHVVVPGWTRDRWPLGRTLRPAIPAFAGMTDGGDA